ncbi:MAG: Nre family DNA repair protein [Candidatus Bathyarchaeia archaeon]
MTKRVAKRFKPKNDWVRDLVSSDPDMASGLDVTADYLRLQAPKNNLCSVCKGSKLLCGKTGCPLLARMGVLTKMFQSVKGKEVAGSSPPSAFVGRIGYPYVYIGPLSPTYYGDTSILDAPERWFGKSMDEIISYRAQLIRGMEKVDVRKPWKADKILDKTRELSLAEHYVETEMKLKKRPRKRLYMDGDVQPIGPTAPVERIDIGYIKWNREMEEAYYDTDLKAASATIDLYEEGVPISSIVRAFSMGSFGIGKNRRLVPTRWSITAVDDLLGKNMINHVKDYPPINYYEVYESNYLGNRFLIFLLPDAWSYEAYEAWYPKTLWNPSSMEVAIVTDWEPYDGRWRYASMGGCYYAGRLAALEHLIDERKQAKVFIFREAYPDYIMPVGVWQVRENCRNAMKRDPRRFETLGSALDYTMSRLTIPLEKWKDVGPLLRHTLTQRKITDYL